MTMGAVRVDLETTSFARTYHGPIARLAAELERADVGNFRTLSDDRSWQGIVARVSIPIAKRLTSRGRELVAEIGQMSASVLARGSARSGGSTLPPAFLSFEQCMDTAVRALGATSSVQTVDDLAFLVCAELRQRFDRLARLSEDAPPIAVLGECDSAFRRVRKGLTAIDAAIAAVEGVAPVLSYTSELEHSLSVRRAYGRVRMFVEKSAEDEACSRLRGLAARLVSLAEGAIAPRLRIADRLTILELRTRIDQWLLAAPSARPSVERLWQDVVGFVEMLGLVNRRQELVEHDRAASLKLVRETGLSAEEQARLWSSLEGLDPELDRVLADETLGESLRTRRALEVLVLRQHVHQGDAE